MRRIILGLAVAATASAAQAQANIPPSQGLPTCSGIYAAMTVFASPENKPVLRERATQIAMASKQYNANGPDDAINQARYIIARVNANDSRVVEQTINAEKNCRVYLKQYGL